MHRFSRGLIAACLFVGLIIIGGFYAWAHHPWLLSAHYNLKLATGPMGNDGQKLMSAFLRELGATYRLIRMVPLETADLSESAKALMDGRADLAVVRSDNDAAVQGRTIFILRKTAIAILLPPKSTIENAQALVGKRIGIVEPAHPDDPLIKKLSDFYGMKRADFVPIAMKDAGPALQQHRIAAALVLGPVGPGPIADTFSSVRRSFKAAPTFLDIGETEAIVAQSQAYEALEIPQGSFGGTPPEPAQAINTIALSVRLVSRASLPDRFAGETTRLLLATRQKLFATVPAVAQMEAPEADKTAALPIHPGTLAFLNGEQVSLLDETLNLYWYAGMAAAVLGPAAGWAIAVVRRRRGDEVREKLLRMLELFRVARSGTPEELDRTDKELEDLLEWFFHLMVKGDLERDQFQCIERMISQMRTTIERRRQGKPDAPPILNAA
jgi:TRAP-type uncharacterized transport system substrate-binding protein